MVVDASESTVPSMSVIAHVGLNPSDFIDWVMLYDVLGGQGCQNPGL